MPAGHVKMLSNLCSKGLMSFIVCGAVTARLWPSVVRPNRQICMVPSHSRAVNILKGFVICQQPGSTTAGHCSRKEEEENEQDDEEEEETKKMKKKRRRRKNCACECSPWPGVMSLTCGHNDSAIDDRNEDECTSSRSILRCEP